MDAKTIIKPAVKDVAQVVTDLFVSLPSDLGLTYTQVGKDSGIDFYKYRNRCSVPSIKSLVDGFSVLNRPLDLVFFLARNVVDQTITFDQVRSVLKDWDLCKGYAEGRNEELLKRIVGMSYTRIE
jgi:hypothetical protein